MKRRPRKSLRSSSSYQDYGYEYDDYDRPDDFDRPDRDRPDREPPGGKPSWLNSLVIAAFAGIFVIGIAIGTLFSSGTNLTPVNVASSIQIDRSAPNPELCVQYGASAIAVDLRAFVTLNPFNVFISQPLMRPGCVLRSNNWTVLERTDHVTSQDLRQCKNRMNTFGFIGDIESQNEDVEVDCVYQNDSARNLFFDQPGLRNAPAETNRF